MALPNDSRRAPSGRGRRPQDAPRLSAVPTPPTDADPPAPAAPPAPGGLPDAVARAVRTPPKATSATPAEQGGERVEKPSKGPRPTPASAPAPASKPSPERGSDQEVAVVEESQTAADVARTVTWLGVTYRPPDIWRERQPCLKEELDFVMAGEHLPAEGPWRLLARVYAAPAMAVIAVLHALIWILRSPARHATVWVLGLLGGLTAAFML